MLACFRAQWLNLKMEVAGFEPQTFRQFGAGDGIRTHVANLGKVVLYP
jgi:hypothetical protein